MPWGNQDAKFPLQSHVPFPGLHGVAILIMAGGN